MQRSIVILELMLIMIIALLFYGCGSKDRSTVSDPVSIEEPMGAISEEGDPTGQIAFNVRYLYPSGKMAKTAVVDRMTAYVYEPEGAEPIGQADLERVGDRGKASIKVPAGNDRIVDLVAYDDTLVSWLGSDEDVDVVGVPTTFALKYALSEILTHFTPFQGGNQQKNSPRDENTTSTKRIFDHCILLGINRFILRA